MSNFLTKAFEPQIKQANSKLQQMPEKDRQALLALSVFAAILIFLYAIYFPLEAYHDNARQNSEVSQELYQWLKSKESQAKAISKKPKGAVSSNDSLLTQVTEASKNNGLSLKRVQPEGNDKIRLWLEDVPFNQVLIALDKLQTERGLKIEEVSIDRKAPGKVDARATISR